MPESPACLRALADATARWPARSRASDGIMGDAAHQKRASDHNVGDAFDLTHDPAGPTGNFVAAWAALDRRIKYVIWNRRIGTPLQLGSGRGVRWSVYTGENPHTSHVHVSVLRELRDDGGAWAWAPRAAPSLLVGVGVVAGVGLVVYGGSRLLRLRR